MKKEKWSNIYKIIYVLAQNPDGLWLRQLSKSTKIPLASLHRYLKKDLINLTENIGVQDKNGKYIGMRIIRLKPKVIETLQNEGFEKIVDFIKISRKV